MSKRFNELNGKDVNEFIETEENQNNKRKTELDINLIHCYIANEAGCHVNRPPKMVELSPSQLDIYLSIFLLAVRKKNSQDYEPTTLEGFVSSVERYVRKKHMLLPKKPLREKANQLFNCCSKKSRHKRVGDPSIVSKIF